jgi:hypothetical protein
MARFRLEQSQTEIYTAQAGLALVGHVVKTFTDMVKQAWSSKLERCPDATGFPISI